MSESHQSEEEINKGQISCDSRKRNYSAMNDSVPDSISSNNSPSVNSKRQHMNNGISLEECLSNEESSDDTTESSNNDNNNDKNHSNSDDLVQKENPSSSLKSTDENNNITMENSKCNSQDNLESKQSQFVHSEAKSTIDPVNLPLNKQNNINTTPNPMNSYGINMIPQNNKNATYPILYPYAISPIPCVYPCYFTNGLGTIFQMPVIYSQTPGVYNPVVLTSPSSANPSNKPLLQPVIGFLNPSFTNPAKKPLYSRDGRVSNLAIKTPNEENQQSQLRCSCEKTHCLKLYCDCLKAGKECGPLCSCKGCLNKNSCKERAFAISFLKKKNNSSHIYDQDDIHQSFSNDSCSCQRSQCCKKYCSCYLKGEKCTSLCSCLNCRNK